MPDPSFFLPLILQSAVIPFGVALAVLAALRTLRAGAIAPALAIAAGVLGTFFAILHAQWSPVPKVALDWLPWIAVVGTAGVLGAERVSNAGLRLAARFALSATVGAVVTWPALASLGVQKAVLIIGAAGVVLSLVWSIMARTADSRPTPPLLLAVVAGGAGMTLMLDSSQSIGQLNGALASALAACVVFILPRMRTAFSPAAAGVAVLLLGALLINAYIYAGFPLGYIVLLAGGLIADQVVEGMNRFRRRSGGAGSWAAATVLAAIPVVVTIGLAVKAAADSGGY